MISSNPTIQGDMSHARKTGAGTSSPHCDDCNNKEMKLHQRTCQVGVLQSGCLQVPLAQNSLTKIKESSNNVPMTQVAPQAVACFLLWTLAVAFFFYGGEWFKSSKYQLSQVWISRQFFSFHVPPVCISKILVYIYCHPFPMP